MSYLNNVAAIKSVIDEVGDFGSRIHDGVRHLRDHDRIHTLLAGEGEGLYSICGCFVERVSREEMPYTQLSTIGSERWTVTILLGYVQSEPSRMESIVGRLKRAIRDKYQLGDLYDVDVIGVSDTVITRSFGLEMERVELDIQGTEHFTMSDPGMILEKNTNTDFSATNQERDRFETGIEEDIASILVQNAPSAQVLLGHKDMSTKEKLEMYLRSTSDAEDVPRVHSYQVLRDEDKELSGIGKRTVSDNQWIIHGVMSWSDSARTYERFQVELDNLASYFRFYRHVGSRENWTQIISSPLQIESVSSVYLYDTMVHKADMSLDVSETVHCVRDV